MSGSFAPHEHDNDAHNTDLRSLLMRGGLEEYLPMFKNNGFEDFRDVGRLTEGDLTQLGMKKEHVVKFIKILRDEKRTVASHPVLEVPSSSVKGGRRRSNTYTPASPLAVRSQPKTHHKGGNTILVDLIAAKLEYPEPVLSQVKFSICKTVDDRGIPIESTVRRSHIQKGAQPAWHDLYEFPIIYSEKHFLVCAVNEKTDRGLTGQRLGLVAIPMKFFTTFTNSTVIDNWFPLKLGQAQKTGEVHLRLRIPGGFPSQVGRAFKVTGVRMDNRKLIAEIIEGEVPPNSEGHPRSTYVKVTLPNNLEVCRETHVQKDCATPVWKEGFAFFSEVKNSQYLIVKLKKYKVMSRRTIGIAKIPLLFFLSLKDPTVIDNWFAAKDEEGTVRGKVRVRLMVVPREDDEVGLIHAKEHGYPLREPVILAREAEEDTDALFEKDAGGGDDEEEEGEDLLKEREDLPDEQEQLSEEPDPSEEEEGDDTWLIEHHEEDFTPYSPKPISEHRNVFWPPPEGSAFDPDILSQPAS
eukprot:TRINITY_DN3476_c0_g2_i1.p1 TRINITY_DN3476_c0_g2~~TRINITY_DN3476_c0_g2_i1.p1  ORF type:complete len:522 (+),score=82.96 TRINITY_DN3476_c0_g2_i1:113-1678(+)